MKRNKKIYIAGCGGMLGEAFYENFKDDFDLKCTDIDLNETWISYLDFRDFDKYLKDVSEYKPDYLFHIGAFTDLEFCEQNIIETYRTNTISVENAVFISNKLGIPLLFISTAGIFDGKKDTYDDWDIPNPLGHYARSKFAAENFVLNNCNKYLICRAGWMMGGGPQKDKKFVQKIMKQIKAGQQQLHVVNDKLGTPTYTHDFAKNVKLLLEREYWGLYNMVCEGITGRYEVAQELLNILGLEKKIQLIDVNSDYWKSEYFAERPPSERLLDTKLNIRNINIMRDWKVCLKEYLDKYYKNYL